LDAIIDELAQRFLAKSSLNIKLVRDAFYQCADTTELDAAMQKGTELGIRTWQTEDGRRGCVRFWEKAPCLEVSKKPKGVSTSSQELSGNS
jgi:enoyl-CoA hydratase/carnithine racemase